MWSLDLILAAVLLHRVILQAQFENDFLFFLVALETISVQDLQINVDAFVFNGA